MSKPAPKVGMTVRLLSGHTYTVQSVKLGEIAGPHVRLSGDGPDAGGLIAWSICGEVLEAGRGRPRSESPREQRSIRLASETWAKLEAEAERRGVNLGRLLDDLAGSL